MAEIPPSFVCVYPFLRFSCTFGVPKWLPRHILCPNVTEIVAVCYMVQRYATQCYKTKIPTGVKR